MQPIDRLLTELRSVPPEERHPVWVLRRFSELGEVTAPPTVDPPAWLQRAIVDAVRDVSQGWSQSAFFGAVRMLRSGASSSPCRHRAG